MRSLLLLVLIGCAAEPPLGPEVISCEESGSTDVSAPRFDLDLMLVVSDSPGMAPYRDGLIENLTRAGQVLTENGSAPSLRITVVDARGALTAQPHLPGCAAPDARFLEDLDQPWFWCADTQPGECRRRNYQGTLGQAIACIGSVPADGAAPPPLLARLVDALDEDGVLRPDGHLAVVLIGIDDDASPASDPAFYAERLRAARPDPAKLIIASVGGPDTPRFERFLSMFPGRALNGSMDSDWSYLFEFFLGDAGDLNGCLDASNLLDLDPSAAGLQSDCVVTEADGSAVIPQCLMSTVDRPDPSTALPCYWIHPSRWSVPFCEFQATVERERPGPLAVIRCACVP